jgi:sulfonate transport system ATP-binding protein
VAAGGGGPVIVTQAAVRVTGLVHCYEERRILDDLDLTIAPGEFVALLGASGSGKTTLLRLLAGLERPTDGKVLVPRRRTVVFQEPRLVPSKRVIDNVRIGLPATSENLDASRLALQEVGLATHEKAWPGTLSGGEAQRVALARALVRRPELLLLDEPFASLDALTRLSMQGLVAELCARHRPAVLLVTHDVDEAVLLADRVLVLQGGRLGVDIVVNLLRPRTRDGAFESLRQYLLSELGVLEEPRITSSLAAR